MTNITMRCSPPLETITISMKYVSADQFDDFWEVTEEIIQQTRSTKCKGKKQPDLCNSDTSLLAMILLPAIHTLLGSS